MLKQILFLFFLFISFYLKSQDFTSSNLPILIISTDNNTNIVDEPKITATMKIIFRPDGSRNYMSDVEHPAFLEYYGEK